NLNELALILVIYLFSPFSFLYLSTIILPSIPTILPFVIYVQKTSACLPQTSILIKSTLFSPCKLLYPLSTAKEKLVNALFFSPTYLNSGSLVSLPTKTTLFIQYRLLIYIYFILSVGL